MRNAFFRRLRQAGIPLLALTFLMGVLAWGAFNTALEVTNTESFCISCHEMADNVYPEYQHSVHYRNPTGVRATCPDCHVPRDWGHKVARKIRASNELYHKLVGSIDSREKFLHKRLELARMVWADMQASDSRECRNCHDFHYMDYARQAGDIGARHRKAQQAGRTCIDCHKGIAHKLPAEFIRAEHQRFKRDQVACSDCHAGMSPPQTIEW